MQRALSRSWMCTVLVWALECCTLGNGACFGEKCTSHLSCEGNNATGLSRVIGGLLQDYDRALTPTYHEGTPTSVTCDIYVNSFDSISVDTMDFSVNIYMRQRWRDERLAFHKLHPNLTRLTLDYRSFERLWLPDVFFPNEKAASTHCVTVPNSMIRIAPNGSVLFSSRYTLRLACHMNLRSFPLDIQECSMRIESYGRTTDEMQLNWDLEAVQINENLELAQFDLIGVSYRHCQKSYITGDFACLEAQFTLKRQYGYFMIQTYVPSILIVTLSWVAFWINIDAVPARISLGVLTVLTLTTQCVGVWMSLPRVSYIKAIDVWMSMCIFMVYTAMLEFAVVNTLSRKETRRLSMRARNHGGNHGGNNGGNGGGNSSAGINTAVRRCAEHTSYGCAQKFDPNSRLLARKVDKVSRWLFPSIFAIFNITYWCAYLL